MPQEETCFNSLLAPSEEHLAILLGQRHLAVMQRQMAPRQKSLVYNSINTSIPSFAQHYCNIRPVALLAIVDSLEPAIC